MKNRIKLISSIGAIVLALTLILGFINIKDWSGINLVAFLFILLAEIILFAGFILVELSSAKTEQIAYRSGMYIAITIYSLATIAVSLFYMIFTEKSINSFWTIQLILLAILLMICLALYNTSKSFRQKDEKVLFAVAKIEEYVGRLNILSGNNSDKTYGLKLKKIAEDLQFTDVSTTVSADNEIGDSISLLEENLAKEEVKEEDIEELLNKMSSLIDRRKMEVSASKRGRI
ncbi:hypothetical protein LJC13_02090 [Peptostreptococcaceae bacterium OttesenSCG-928-C18]|nr:hypothetical protein [Peptostreptococcaceae bacterium OttesenSCG-928-C18]